MKRIILTKILALAWLISTNAMADRCPDESFDLKFLSILPELVQSQEELHVTVEASNIPGKVFDRGVERVEWHYEIYGYRKLETPETGTIGNCKKNCIGYLRTHEEVLLTDFVVESPTFTAIKTTSIQLPVIPIDYENKIWIRVFMDIDYKANFFEKLLYGCDVNYVYADVDKEQVVCHTPSITYNVLESAPIADHIPALNFIRGRDAIARGIPLGQTETTLRPRLGGLEIGGLHLSWATDHAEWTLSSQTGTVYENIILHSDGYSTHGEVTVTIDALECSSGPKSFSGVPIHRFVPRPPFVAGPSNVCDNNESTLEIEPHPFATGYVWELVKGPVILNGQNVQTITTTEPRLNITANGYGNTHVRVRYKTNIDHLVENNDLLMQYDMEYDRLNATIPQKISSLRWRNFEFWSGGSGPTTPITRTSYVVENCKGPVETYATNQPAGADRYEWEFISLQTPVPSYFPDIIHVEDNQFSVDGYIRMNDGESIRFLARVKVYGVNNCTPEVEEKTIGYRYFTNDPDGTCQGIFSDGFTSGRIDEQTEALTDSNEINTAGDISIFPNPASDVLGLNFHDQESYSVSIYNTSKQLVYQDTDAHTKLSLNVSNYPQGLYIVNVHNDQGNLVQASKVLIQH